MRRQTEMMPPRTIPLVFIILVLGSASGCGMVNPTTPPAHARPTYTAQSNLLRSRLGIRQVKAGWKYDGLTADANTVDTWQSHELRGWRNGKIVEFGKDHSHVVWERDYYYSGRIFTDPDPHNGTDEELLAIDYDYGSQRFLINYVGIDRTSRALLEDLSTASDGPPGVAGQSMAYVARTNADTLAVADEILRRWHLSRQ
jgi:hypothetical protein